MRKTILFLTISLFFISCSKESELSEIVDANSNESVLSVKELVDKYGFDSRNMRQFGDTIIVNGDIAISEKRLREEYRFSTAPRQAVIHKNTILNDKDLNIYISPNFNATDQNIIKDALNEFLTVNLGFPYSGFNSITYVTSPTSADASIETYVDYPNVCGVAAFPITEKNLGFVMAPRWYIGEYMKINVIAFKTMSAGQKKQLIAHEFGHQLGIRHTNWLGLGEPSITSYNGKVIGAYQVVGTINLSQNPDPVSVFNGENCGSSWIGFTTGDKLAIRAVTLSTLGESYIGN